MKQTSINIPVQIFSDFKTLAPADAQLLEAARRATVPGMILVVLCTLIIVSAFLSGYGSKNLERNKVLVLAFAFITTLALYLVVDLDKPRQGFVNLNSTEQLLVGLRDLFSEKK